jgi:hypothetical protein
MATAIRVSEQIEATATAGEVARWGWAKTGGCSRSSAARVIPHRLMRLVHHDSPVREVWQLTDRKIGKAGRTVPSSAAAAGEVSTRDYRVFSRACLPLKGIAKGVQKKAL